MSNMPDTIFVSRVINPNGTKDWTVTEQWNEYDECYVKWSDVPKTFWMRVNEEWDNPDFNNVVTDAAFEFLRRVVNGIDS